MSIPLISAQITPYASDRDDSKEPYRTIALVYEAMFPALDDIPDAKRLNTIGYLHGVMRDDRVTQDDKDLIVNGARWLDEESDELFKKTFHQLTSKERQKVLGSALEYRWGDNWVYTLMSYLFESMFCDPIYGANTDMSGWKWLEYEPGFPRPTKVLA